MKFPISIEFGGYSISAHLLFETLAFVIGFRYFLYLRRRQHDPIDDSNRIWIFIGATAGAFLFSRLIGALEDPRQFVDPENGLLYYYTQKTIVGGLLGGLLMVEITKKVIGVKTSSGDLFTFPLILAMIIGRIGCFSAGVYEQTFGTESNLPWAMNLGDGVLRHPIALYEIMFLILLWIGIYQTERAMVLENGLRFKLFLISYLVFRFFIDFIKPGYHVALGLTVIQPTCLAGLLYYFKTIRTLVLTPGKLRVT
jgi:phosphatidylglycerol:prolipoprotein diacylglycerol transferase